MVDIQSVISSLSPLDGALAFLNELRSVVSVVLLSDTFEEFIRPLMLQLENPLVLCHRLFVDEDGHISSFVERTPNQKFEAVRAFQKLNYQVIAAGDSYNDLAMIDEADAGFYLEHRTMSAPKGPTLPALMSTLICSHLLRKLLKQLLVPLNRQS